VKAEAHRQKYRLFKDDALREQSSKAIRMEALFLAAFHLIEACAARRRAHIGKHQRVRAELEADPDILGAASRSVVAAFRVLERDLRPKFLYGESATEEDFALALRTFAELERACLEVLS